MQVCSACGEENLEHSRFCHACGTALVERPAASEERKLVSVLFVDLVGFTDRSDRADPEDVRATLRPYHERVKEEIERFGGTVEKFIGDAVMAVFGAPAAHEDDAERAVRAGLRILDAIEELNEERPGLELAVRAAVTTGEAVVSLAARPERGEGIATGDVVNVAARLQSAAPVGALLVDGPTTRSTSDAIDYAALDPVVAKGKAEPIAVWRATGARSRFGVDAELRTQTPFVGRERDLAILLDTFERVLDEPSVQLVTLVGEPGLGKSRLVWELGRAVDRRPELVRWRQGRCLPYGEGITFWALGEIVKAETGILESDSPADAEAKLGRAVAAVVEDEDERRWFVERLAPLVGAREETAVAAREEAFSAWRRYFEALASDAPLVLVFEDLHWADEALLDFLENVLDWAPAIPLLVVATARPELYTTRPDWGGGRRNSTTVGLAPLSDEETAHLVARLLDQSVLSAETQSVLLERAGGNPLYTEQFVRMLAESGTADIGVPESVHALIAARLDTLEPEAKASLQDASVLGKVFWTGALAEMGERDRETVLRSLRELVRREFVRPSRASSMREEEEFSFWHVLVRDVAYQQIPRAARSRKHVEAATWTEDAAEDRISDHAEILVHHYEQAAELARAAGNAALAHEIEPRLGQFLVLAGDRAMRLDVAAAEAAYRRALALTPEGAPRAAVLVKVANALQEQGALRDASETYLAALAELRAPEDERLIAIAQVGLSRTLWRIGETARSRDVIAEAIPVLQRDRGPELLTAFEYAATVDVLGGRSREGLEWAEKGIALGQELGIENVVRHLQMRGLARIDLGDLDGVADMRAALDLSLRLGLGFETASAYNNLGEIVAAHEHLPSGLALSEASAEHARRRGLTHHEMWTRASRLWPLYELGRWDELFAEREVVLGWDRAQGGTQIEAQALMFSAAVLVHRGRLEDARADVAVFLPRAREIADPQMLAPALGWAAFVYAVAGNLDEALALGSEFELLTRGRSSWRLPGLSSFSRIAVAAGDLGLCETMLEDSPANPGSPPQRAAVSTARAVLAESRGETKEAARLYRAAAEDLGEWGSVVERAYALHDLGRCGDADAAREAREIFDRLRAVPLTVIAA